ncbi:hypothetical protein SAMN04488128_103203 [Chitinophaga eiseniae]|uniref:Uncharacterized protein n=1 Tax=Chitinophaga eiseniae TaxID=634771 RepID=A0A1T4SP97_9BACT|nr:hypothetical protein [Chitinophaga eiseniae]SKA30012.1 hypothetical protein SAMN04488128_103203 [Chitinophaga eiseniae]
MKTNNNINVVGFSASEDGDLFIAWDLGEVPQPYEEMPVGEVQEAMMQAGIIEDYNQEMVLLRYRNPWMGYTGEWVGFHDYLRRRLDNDKNFCLKLLSTKYQNAKS